MLATCPTVKRISLLLSTVFFFRIHVSVCVENATAAHIPPHFDKSLPLDWKAVYISTGSERFASDT